MTAWLEHLCGLDSDAVLVTVMETRGSTPRGVGTHMLVTPHEIFGTVGGGQLEHRIVELARRQLAAGIERASREVHGFTLGPELRQCCGGVVKVAVDALPAGKRAWVEHLRSGLESGPCIVLSQLPSGEQPVELSHLIVGATGTHGSLGDVSTDVRAMRLARRALKVGHDSRIQAPAGMRLITATAARPALLLEIANDVDLHIVLFGAGHVGKALVKVLGGLPCRITWVDSRAEEFPALIPANVNVQVSERPLDIVGAAPPASFFLVMTHSHPTDFQICKAVLERDSAYLGLIGSKSKRARFRKNLIRQGIPADQTRRLTCPIGVDTISGKHPAAIAIATAAQVLERHERRRRSGVTPTTARARASSEV